MTKHLVVVNRILISRNLLNEHMGVIRTFYHVAIMVDYHSLRYLDSSTIIVEMNWAKVFIASLFLSFLTWGIAKL